MEGLLEREAELGRIDALIAGAAAGIGATLRIEGPAGIGKTELVAAARASARAAGLSVLVARGAELEIGFPFGVVRQLFGDDAIREKEDGITALRALYRRVEEEAIRHPLLITVDDAHWADPPSLRFLGYLRPRIADMSALLVIAVRTGERPSDTALLDQVAAGRDGVTAIEPSAAAAGLAVGPRQVVPAGA